MSRWLSADSVKLYARMTKQKYDTARTTGLPVMDAADAIAAWGKELHLDGAGRPDKWNDTRTIERVDPSPLKAGERVEIYWTESQEWYTGTFTSSRVENADGGGQQRASRIVYDATGLWAKCSEAQLTY